MALTPEARVPFRDAGLSPQQRAGDLLSRLPLEDKAGLLFHGLTLFGSASGMDTQLRVPSLESTIAKYRINHIAVIGDARGPRAFAEWHNAAQDFAAKVGLGIPITFSSDPRHGFVSNPAAGTAATMFSQWPENLGFGALREEALVRRFGEIVRREYAAVGIRLALGPQIDVATEPRWSRVFGTFGEDPELVARLGAAYIRGLQGRGVGPGTVAAMAKHFPGGGPQKDGEDPHFVYGKEQVYPGGRIADHLKPFVAAIGAGVSQVMPYYGMPIGTDFDEVGFAYNKAIVTELLRNELGFEGIVCTDFGVITDTVIFGAPLPARAWGVEHLTRQERMARLLDAGCDQFGGEFHSEELVAAVRAGLVTEERIDASAQRLLEEKFALGLFDARHVDPAYAEQVVGSAKFREPGLAAQRSAMTLLTNGSAAAPTLPLRGPVRLYLENIDAAGFAEFDVVATPAEADVAILRLAAPFEPREHGFEAFFHAGSLDYSAAIAEDVLDVCATVPTVLVVGLDRPAILTPFVGAAAAIIAEFGATDAVVADVLTGRAEPKGRLPMDLPRSMGAVRAAASDAPFDMADALFRYGHGLRYAR